MKEIIVYKDKAYTLSDESVKEYEAGVICFVDHSGEAVYPSYIGRGGDCFHCTFKLKEKDNESDL